MRLVEGIAGKAFHLPPDLAADLLVIALGLAVGEKLIFDLDQMVFAAIFARHHAPEHIGIGHIQSAIGIGNLHYILLIDHDPIGLFELLLKHGMWIDDRARIVVPTDVFAHHTRTGYARTDNGRGCHQGQVVITAQLGKQLPHRRALDIETADGIGRLELCSNLGILKKSLWIIGINDYTEIFPHNGTAIFDMTDTALREDIKFFKADIFGHIHIKLHGGQSLWRIVHG
ncbi:hypothetical protein D3C80_1142760 [compost metagenome]